MAVELNNSTANNWSETDASNTASPPDGAPAGMFPNASEGVWRGTMATVKRFWNRINGAITTTGSANAYIYTPSNTSYPTAYVQGEIYTFKANFANTGAATLNINSLGATNIYKKGASGATALTGAEIQSGDLVSVAYDGTQFQLMGSYNSSIISNQDQYAFLTSGTTWTSPSGITSSTVFKITGTGGGGGGGGSNNSNLTSGGGGGGAGAFVLYISGLTASTGYTYAIGASGAGGNNSGGNGSSGGATSITIGATTATANGGAGGMGGTSGGAENAGGSGGSSSNGTINIVGQDGSKSFAASNSSGGGQGGNVGFGLGLGGAIAVQPGKAGTGYGSGGSGGNTGGSGTGQSGGAGASGAIIIEWIQ